MITDTERLDFLLNYFTIDDIGDEKYVCGTVILADELETVLQTGVHVTRVPNLRTVIDRAIAYQKLREEE